MAIKTRTKRLHILHRLHDLLPPPPLSSNNANTIPPARQLHTLGSRAPRLKPDSFPSHPASKHPIPHSHTSHPNIESRKRAKHFKAPPPISRLLLRRPHNLPTLPNGFLLPQPLPNTPPRHSILRNPPPGPLPRIPTDQFNVRARTLPAHTRSFPKSKSAGRRPYPVFP